MSIKITLRAAAVIGSMTAVVLLSACEPILPAAYAPRTFVELGGAIDVKTFRYNPKQNVAQDEVYQTAFCRPHLSEPVGEYVANAIRLEFRQAGISLRTTECALTGDINDLWIDNLGFSADYISEVRYLLQARAVDVLFDRTFKVKISESKANGNNFVENFNKSIADNIRQLLADTAFVDSLTKNCPRAP